MPNKGILYTLPVVLACLILAWVYQKGVESAEGQADRAAIETLERIQDAELSSGDVSDDRDVILDFLRAN